MHALINMKSTKLKKFSLQQRIRSFGYAFNGLKILFREEHNSRIHLLAAIAAIVTGFYFHIAFIEWVAIVCAIGLVFSLELINSSIEAIADFVSPEKNALIKKAKDLSAAAVIVSALVALVIGFIVFLPKIINLL